jgi:purine-binding chemotaxis protein CheW
MERSAALNVPGFAGKYLTFRLANEEYGIGLLMVKEIIGLMVFTKIPKTPDFIRGVIDIRGTVIPVIELRRKFGIETTADTEETCIIIVEVPHKGKIMPMGILVDSVSEVLEIAGDNIEASPDFGSDIDTRFILGMAKRENYVTILLNIEQVLTEMETDAIANT